MLPRHATAPLLPPPGHSNDTVPLRLCRDYLDYAREKRGSVNDERLVLLAELFEHKHVKLWRESRTVNGYAADLAPENCRGHGQTRRHGSQPGDL